MYIFKRLALVDKASRLNSFSEFLFARLLFNLLARLTKQPSKVLLIFCVSALGLLGRTESAAAQAVINNTTSGNFNVNNAFCGNNQFLIRSFSVNNNFSVSGVTLGLNVTHPYRGAIAGILQSPSGTTAQFLGIDGADTNDNYDILLRNGGGAANDGTNDNTGTPFYDRSVNPFSPFSVFSGEQAIGTWNLYLCDGGSNNTGTFNRSQLTLSSLSNTVSGFAFDDVNKNDIRDNNESVLSNIGVTAYRDDGDGIFEPGAGDTLFASGQTGTTGAYSFSGLTNGRYWIDVDETDSDLAGRTYGGSAATNTADPRLINYSGTAINNVNFPFDQDLQALCDPGDPTGELSFIDGATLESGSALQVGAVYRFSDIFPNVDGLVEVVAFNNGATLGSIDNDNTGVQAAFQPTLNGTSGATSSVDFRITFVEKGTSTPVAITFKASGVDIDGDGGTLREFIELTGLESFTNGSSLTATQLGPQQVRFESNTTTVQPGISATATQAIATAQYTVTSQLNYRLGGIDGGNSAAIQRLNSLYFGCTDGPVASSISGFAFDDVNANSTRESSENVLSDISVAAYRDDGDNVFEPGGDDVLVATTQTATSGAYTFAGLTNGSYWIDVDETDADLAGRSYAGSADAGTADPRLVTFAGTAIENIDFPFTQALLSLCDPGDPTGELSFINGAVLESGSNLQVGAVYRFSDIFPNVDGLVEVVAFNDGATLAAIDNNNDGVAAAFQPTLNGTSGATSSVDFRITFVEADTSTPVAITFKASGVDIDGDNGTLREFIELTGLDSFTNGSSLTATQLGPQQVRFESNTTTVQPGISVTATQAIATAQYIATSELNYRIGGIDEGNSAAIQRLNSLYFACTDGPVAVNADLLLVKRVTAINNNRTQNPNDGTVLNQFIDDTSGPRADDDNNDKWPSNYLLGAIDGGSINPPINGSTDAVEYSVYFLSVGNTVAEKVLVCDRIPQNTSFLPDAYTGLLSADPQGTPGSPLGIAFAFEGSEVALTGEDDGDAGYYFPPNVEPSTQFPNVVCGGPNDNGAVVVNIGDLSSATSAGSPNNAFGTLRFQVEVN